MRANQHLPELLGKGFDLRLVDDVRSTGEALAHKEIVEIELRSSEFLASTMSHLRSFTSRATLEYRLRTP